MANACIAYTNLVDTAPAISATSSNLLLPVANVTNPHVARKWRGTTPGADSVIVDMGAPVDFDTVATFGLNCSTIDFRCSLVDPTGSAGEVFAPSIGTVDGAYNSRIELAPSVLSARYFRFDCVADASSYCEIGRIFIGVRTQFKYNFTKGWSRGWNDTSLRSKTRGGQTQIFPDSVFRVYDVSFDFITKVDRDGFIEDIDRVNALKTDVLFITDPDSTNLARDSVWGLMTAITPVVQPSVSTFTKQYTIEERL